jgi:hypothetical protein
MSEPSVDTEIWTKIASGSLGDHIDWEPGFEALSNVYWLLIRLGETEVDRLDWDELIGQHHYFEALRDSLPLGDESDFEQYFSDFLATTSDPDEAEMPGDCFVRLDLYIAIGAKEPVVREFESFERHLRSISVVQEAIA